MPKTIHYADVYKLGSKLVRTSDIIEKGYVYQQCPAFTHKNERTFVGYSPIELVFSIERTSNGPLLSIQDNSMIQFIDIDDQHINSPMPVFQLYIPKFLFWTHDDDVWFEFNDHPMTALNNNFVAVPGWFNLSNWSRGCSLALTIVNESKPVIIKKGDPLFRVAFHPPNLNDGIILSQEKDPQKIDLIYEEYDKKMKEGQADKRWKPKLFSQTGESKCPFSFLFK